MAQNLKKRRREHIINKHPPPLHKKRQYMHKTQLSARKFF